MIDKEIGTSSWNETTQNNVDNFANITYSGYNYIHQKKSKERGSPYGDPIAQGMYILSLCDSFSDEVIGNNAKLFSLQYQSAGINGGFNKVRCVAPCYVGSRCRAIYRLKDVSFGKKANSLRFVYDITVQNRGKESDKIANVAFVELVSVIVYSFNL